MYYGGIDAHRTYLTIAVVDKSGEVIEETRRVPIGDGGPLLEALAEIRPLEVVVETCSFWPWIHDTLEPTEIGFHLAHASKLEAIAQARTKTDSIDARLLARMLAGGLIPEVYPKPPAQREICRLVRHRRRLVEQRTRLASRIHGHLHQQGLWVKKGRLLTVKGRRWLRDEAWTWLTLEQRALAETHLELIDTVSEQVHELDGRIRSTVDRNPDASLLETIPGIGAYRALRLVGEITPISRFPSADRLVSFAGLAPSTRSSGGTTRHGRLPSAANRAVRGALVSTVPSHLRAAPESSLSRYYRRQKERLGGPVARTATARKLARIIHAMLSKDEAWRG